MNKLGSQGAQRSTNPHLLIQLYLNRSSNKSWVSLKRNGSKTTHFIPISCNPALSQPLNRFPSFYDRALVVVWTFDPDFEIMSLYSDLKPVKKTVENYDWKGGGLNLNVGIQNLMNKFWPTYLL